MPYTAVEIADARPQVHADAWVAPTVVLAGRVSIAAQAGVWYASVLRADLDTVTVGARSNIQDGCVVHADPGFPVTVGAGVSVGHRAVLHGCTIEDDVLVGMGAVVLNGARIGAGSLIAAGAVVLEGTEVPPGSLVAGVPGKVRRELGEQERANILRNAESYVALAATHAAATTP
ncbi:gamma carbonic anhydrase family protein [Pseudonocardia sichuanensis]|uniref:Carbonic anhydrase/acetyltransferase-like protein (Isoleucine patch superfamily) n=1 Tax=Pseudonocardia kunmingensis TaxID=630975 RepID=A0A543DWI2_9PSEU|nr:gamma carbonic anhydrase family protein [Pseudonocardia kunmingensis]TQM13675.1 carbonic anhydrase/acetyltransferase-like protein (isoleucine patch superfamily) [Pseudonocardia kunmingensis]